MPTDSSVGVFLQMNKEYKKIIFFVDIFNKVIYNNYKC